MKHLSNLSQNVHVFMAVVALSVGAAGCASGGSDGTGTAGSGTAGGGGSAGSTGTCSLADVNKIFATPTGAISPGCTGSVACHDNKGSAAGLDLVSAGWQTKLVGMGPSAGAATAPIPTMCAGKGPYLVAGSNPATGLLLEKLDPTTTTVPCGLHMPYIQADLTATQFACIKSWATTLTSP